MPFMPCSIQSWHSSTLDVALSTQPLKQCVHDKLWG